MYKIVGPFFLWYLWGLFAEMFLQRNQYRIELVNEPVNDVDVSFQAS
jgi:hypothetical protein